MLPTVAMAASAGTGGTAGSAGAGAGSASGAAAPGASAAAPAGATGTSGAGAPAATNGSSASQGKGPAITASMLPEEPSQTYGQQVVIGTALPDDFTYYPVPDYDAYDYIVLDNQRVIVDRGIHRIVEIIP